ncbi:MAG TPA: SDR family oxidoreductase [Pirellulales bacterium]|nr:SDR family oxidoreductase [Pirellulales bacterium]
MELAGKFIVVTGAASGIGRALCRAFAAAGAQGIIVADLDAAAARRTAAEFDALAVGCDVASEADVRSLVGEALRRFGQIDLFCSNAGICFAGGIDAPDTDWQRAMQVNFMAHVYAARAVLPDMLRRREGYLLQTTSAAGLLTQLGSAPYSATKHAAVALAEWLAITYARAGIKVSCLCPQGVRTAMLDDSVGPLADMLRETALEPEQVAQAAVRGIAEERFLILPHPEVGEYFLHRAQDHERWLRGMRRWQDKLDAAGGPSP